MNAPVRSFTFTKKERLTNKKYIGELFSDGSFFRSGPLQVRYLTSAGPGHHQLMIAVPKKHHKKAVIRNKLKRRIREAYRLNKHLLPDTPVYFIAIIYLSKEVLPFSHIQSKLITALQRLQKHDSTIHHEKG